MVDFKHLQEVLVILQLKDYVASPADTLDETEAVNDLTEATETENESETSQPMTAPTAQ